MTAPGTLARHEAKTEPPKRWRNRWHSSVGWSACNICGGNHQIEGTDQWLGCRVHPTEQAARDDAHSQLSARKHEPTIAFVTYLGPEPAP